MSSPLNYNLRTSGSTGTSRQAATSITTQSGSRAQVEQPIFDNMNSIRLESFSGQGQDPAKWFAWFERYAALSNMKDERAAMAMPFHLQGIARTWYDSLTDATQRSVASLRDAFLTRFKRSTHCDLAVLNIVQRATEYVEEYFARFVEVAQGRDLPEPLAVSIVVKGLKPCLVGLVMPQNPQTLDAVRHAMVIAEQTASATMAAHAAT
ncbi:MAG: hypothetical protein ABW168_07845, partial [Sedimenticola sp.]